MAHGAEAVGDHEGGAVAGDLLQATLDGRLGFVVHCGGGFIEDENGWILQQGPR